MFHVAKLDVMLIHLAISLLIEAVLTSTLFFINTDSWESHNAKWVLIPALWGPVGF